MFIVDTYGMLVDSRIIDPLDPSRSWSIEAIRGPGGLRRPEWFSRPFRPSPSAYRVGSEG